MFKFTVYQDNKLLEQLGEILVPQDKLYGTILFKIAKEHCTPTHIEVIDIKNNKIFKERFTDKKEVRTGDQFGILLCEDFIHELTK